MIRPGAVPERAGDNRVFSPFLSVAAAAWGRVPQPGQNAA